jgi:predicted ArsR family transcriptional regulator
VAEPPLTPTEFSSAVTAISAAFGDTTRRNIFLLAREHPDGVTAAEVAEHFHLHANVARHHLDKLAGGGYLEVTVVRAGHAGAGRPSKRYRASASQADLAIPVRQDDLLLTLLDRAVALLPPAVAEDMAEQVGIEHGRVLAAAMGDQGDHQRSIQAALHAVADALTAHGFAAHAERHDDALRIVSEHCPFGDAAHHNPVLCAVDRGLVKGMMAELYGETSPALQASRATGHGVCVTAVD